MNTRLTGRGLHAAAPCWSQAAISAFSRPASTTLPSTPAVLRPALTSVTRRTLTSAPERERSISFCRLRTLPRSPALLAVKIRCRSRRTLSSAWRQSTASQSTTSPSGPLTPGVSSLPIGSGVSDHLIVTGSPDPRQLPFGPGTCPYPASYPRTIWRRCQHCGPRFPAAVSATGIRLLGHPSPTGELSLPHGRPTGTKPAGPQRGCRVAHEQDATGQGAPFTPGTVVRSRPAIILRLAAAPGPGSCRFPPVFSSPAAPGWDTGRFGFFPGLRTPQLPATHAEAETGQRALAQVLHLRPQPDLQQRLPLELMRPHAARSRPLPPSPPRAPARTAASPPAPAPAAWWCRNCGSRPAGAPGPYPMAPGSSPPARPCRCRCRTPGPGTAARRSPLPRVLHLCFPALASLRGGTARGTGGERKNLTRVLVATMNSP